MSAPGRRHGHGEVLHGCRVLGRTGIREGGHPHKASTMLAVFRGIAGQTLTPFALFEKRRNGVLRVFGALRRWRRSGPLRRVRPWPLRRCRRLSRPLKPGPEFPARKAERWLGMSFSRRPTPHSSEFSDTPSGLSASRRVKGQIVWRAGHVVRGWGLPWRGPQSRGPPAPTTPSRSPTRGRWGNCRKDWRWPPRPSRAGCERTVRPVAQEGLVRTGPADPGFPCLSGARRRVL
jgi:hypothetical protein